MEKDVQNLNEENSSLKMRVDLRQANDVMRNQEITKQNQKNEKIENNVKYHLLK